jgi:tetratricopeptide (TPR) repeat protein
MEGKKLRIILPVVCLLATVPLRADYGTEIYSAYVSNKMDNWKAVIERMEAIADKDSELLLELVNYQYGYIGYCIGFDRKDEARKYLSAAQENIDVLEQRGYKLSLVNAYKSAFYGLRIGLNPVTAPFNGRKSMEHAKTAVKLDPYNYLAYIQHGNIQFYMPAAFGGSKKEALGYYLKAKEIFESNPSSIKGNWNYLSLMIVIGQTYTYLKDYDSAKKVYDDLLIMEPGFLYVRDDLYPKLLNKMKN